MSEAREAIIGLTYRYATGVDRRDWALYADCFTDPCTFDFSSFSGTPPMEMTPSAFAERVRVTNGNFDATQHLMSNHVITPDGPGRALAVYELQAQHWFKPETMAELGHPGEVNWCILGGHYEAEVIDQRGVWRYRSVRLTIRWTTGNPDVFPLARSRSTR